MNQPIPFHESPRRRAPSAKPKPMRVPPHRNEDPARGRSGRRPRIAAEPLRATLPVDPAEPERYRGEPPMHLYVERDPCPRCGVRRDIGCGHAPGRLGTRMGL